MGICCICCKHCCQGGPATLDRGRVAHPLPDPAAVAWAAFCGVAVRLITDTARRELDPAVRCFSWCRCTELFKDCIFRECISIRPLAWPQVLSSDTVRFCDSSMSSLFFFIPPFKTLVSITGYNGQQGVPRASALGCIRICFLLQYL